MQGFRRDGRLTYDECRLVAVAPSRLHWESTPVTERSSMSRLALLPALALLLLLPASASALTVSTAQLKGGELRVEGSNARSGFVTAQSSTNLAGGRAVDGKFRIQATGFVAK